MPGGHAPEAGANPFLDLPVGRLFLSNALPMAVVMSMGGVLNVVDGIFVGRFAGPQALAAVSLAFPAVMGLTALSTLLGGGMSSLFARRLGAGLRTEAGAALAGAHGLAALVSAALLLAVLASGPRLLPVLSAGNDAVAGLAGEYLLILVLGAPLQFGLALHADALRNEGRAGLIALLSVLVNLANIAANWVAIVLLGLGVAGSALGTVAAQAAGLLLLLAVRARDPRLVPLGALRRSSWLSDWRQILALGLPLCLGFAGMALVGATVLVAAGGAGPGAAGQVAAYGVATRLLGFAFLPQMAIALATQSITGNNAGAGRMDRAAAALRLALGFAFLWCLCVTLAGTLAGGRLGALFTADPGIAAAAGDVLRPMTALQAAAGPILVLAMHFQAMGHPLRTAALTLVKPWLLTPPLILGLSAVLGPSGLWLAFPVADALMLLLAAAIVARSGLFGPVPAAP
ncbi:MATE family efflux transporter [Mangrovicoccus sp. HB161399]|uniref:MATE family efflux transporter n=1 Tax=Mangrovicoccus sp. HB161399 TaxID=2720392 RepID=UPI0020A64114|nr:MATE family efflux transporter [Mangrovicoccus sp. HB161399]